MSEKKFSKQHEWVTVEGDVAIVGITKHAAKISELPFYKKSYVR